MIATRRSLAGIAEDIYAGVDKTIVQMEGFQEGAPYYSIPIFVPVGFLSLGTILAWTGASAGGYFTFQNRVIIPFFYIMILFCIIIVSLVGTFGVLNAGKFHAYEMIQVDP